MRNFHREHDSFENEQISRLAARFAEEHLRISGEERPSFKREHFTQLGALGLARMSLPESACSHLAVASALFELARAQLGPAIYLSVHLMVSKLLAQWSAKEKTKNEIWPPLLEQLGSGEKLAAFCLTEAAAGSDAANLSTLATRDGDEYLLSGEKIYITSGGIADVYLVFARTAKTGAKGISAFILERGTPGLSFGQAERKMGCEGAPIASVHFENCRVSAAARLGEEGDGYKIALSGLNGGRVNIAACACGLSSRSIELASAHLKSRTQFGQTLSEFQGLQFLLADMLTDLEASILLTRSAAEDLDRGKTSNSAASMAKCFATDAAMKITTDGVQLLGGAGYLADYEVERLMRDAKMLQIVEGTNQIQRVLIARSVLINV